MPMKMVQCCVLRVACVTRDACCARARPRPTDRRTRQKCDRYIDRCNDADAGAGELRPSRHDAPMVTVADVVDGDAARDPRWVTRCLLKAACWAGRLPRETDPGKNESNDSEHDDS